MVRSETSVQKNYLYNAMYQLLLIIAPLITTPYVSRRLGPDMLGIQFYYYSIATYFLLFIMLGVNNYGNRSAAQIKDDKEKLSYTFWSIYGSQFLRAIVVSGIYYGYVFLFSQDYMGIALINGLYVISGFFDITWFFFGLEQFKITVTRNIILKLINIICLFIFIHEPADIWKYSLIIVIITIASNAYLWMYLRKIVFWYRPSFADMRQHIGPELILFVPIIAVSLYKIMDRIMLGIFCTKDQVAYFLSAESVVNIPMSLITALGIVMLPRISHLVAKGDTKKSKRYMEGSMIFVIMMSSAMAFGLSAIAPVFVPLFFGEAFLDCEPLIIGLSLTIFFVSWANVIRTQYLIPYGKDRSYLTSIITGAIVNLAINLMLIPGMGAQGALVGTICAEMTVCFLQTFMVRKELPIWWYFKECIIFLLFGAVMFIVIRGTETFFDNPLLRIFSEIGIGIIVYAILLGIYSWKCDNLVTEAVRSRLLKFKQNR